MSRPVPRRARPAGRRPGPGRAGRGRTGSAAGRRTVLAVLAGAGLAGEPPGAGPAGPGRTGRAAGAGSATLAAAARRAGLPAALPRGKTGGPAEAAGGRRPTATVSRQARRAAGSRPGRPSPPGAGSRPVSQLPGPALGRPALNQGPDLQSFVPRPQSSALPGGEVPQSQCRRLFIAYSNPVPPISGQPRIRLARPWPQEMLSVHIIAHRTIRHTSRS